VVWHSCASDFNDVLQHVDVSCPDRVYYDSCRMSIGGTVSSEDMEDSFSGVISGVASVARADELEGELP
jgi:hypothetical protein